MRCCSSACRAFWSVQPGHVAFKLVSRSTFKLSSSVTTSRCMLWRDLASTSKAADSSCGSQAAALSGDQANIGSDQNRLTFSVGPFLALFMMPTVGVLNAIQLKILPRGKACRHGACRSPFHLQKLASLAAMSAREPCLNSRPGPATVLVPVQVKCHPCA